tara:strand:+ start:425 stop:778 length:354 start_codon:yes stop_codon:yes gene_type:complete
MSDSNAAIERLQKTKQSLHEAADRLSQELGGAPVVVVVGGSSEHGAEATVAGWSNLSNSREGRFRDVVGILQSAIQLESFLHYMEDDLFQGLKGKIERRSWLSSGARAQSGKSQSTE